MPKKPSNSKKEIEARYDNFVNEYVKDFNGTRAAIRAGYARANAHVTASRLLRNDKIQERLRLKTENVAAEKNVDAVRTLNEFARLAFQDYRNMLDEDGKLIPLHKLPPDVSATIKKIKVRQQLRSTPDGDDEVEAENIVEIESWDKVKALESLGKHYKLFDRMNETDPMEMLEKLYDRITPSVGLPSDRDDDS